MTDEVRVRPSAREKTGQCPTKCGFSNAHTHTHTHTHTCARSSTWWVRTRNGHKVGRTHFSLGGTYTKTLTWVLIILIDMHWWDLKQNLFGEFQLSRILIDMHWWDLNTKSFRRISAIKNTY